MPSTKKQELAYHVRKFHGVCDYSSTTTKDVATLQQFCKVYSKRLSLNRILTKHLAAILCECELSEFRELFTKLTPDEDNDKLVWSLKEALGVLAKERAGRTTA